MSEQTAHDVAMGNIPQPTITVNEPVNAPRRGPGRPPGTKNRTSSSSPRPEAPEARKILPDNMPRTRGKKNYATGIEGSLLIIGKLVADIVNPVDGQLITEHAKPIAEGWNTLAQENASVAKVLDSLTSGGAWGAAIMPTASLAIALAANHGALGAFGSMFAKPPSGGLPSEDASTVGNPTG